MENFFKEAICRREQENDPGCGTCIKVCEKKRGAAMNGLKYLALVTQVGVTMIASVGICIAVGLYLDRLLKTRAVFTLVFLLLGCIAAFWSAYRLIMDTLGSNAERK
jgi:ATP synthase protein I